MINSRRLASISRAFDVVLENFIMPEMVALGEIEWVKRLPAGL
jgi:hypothetical protein